jgi:hypothetical protein
MNKVDAGCDLFVEASMKPLVKRSCDAKSDAHLLYQCSRVCSISCLPIGLQYQFLWLYFLLKCAIWMKYAWQTESLAAGA